MLLAQVAGKGMGDIDGATYTSGWGSWNVSQVSMKSGFLTLSFMPLYSTYRQ